MLVSDCEDGAKNSRFELSPSSVFNLPLQSYCVEDEATLTANPKAYKMGSRSWVWHLLTHFCGPAVYLEWICLIWDWKQESKWKLLQVVRDIQPLLHTSASCTLCATNPGVLLFWRCGAFFMIVYRSNLVWITSVNENSMKIAETEEVALGHTGRSVIPERLVRIGRGVSPHPPFQT